MNLAICAAPERLALPRATATAELHAAIRQHGSLRNVPSDQFLRIFFRNDDPALTLTVRRHDSAYSLQALYPTRSHWFGRRPPRNLR